MGMYAKHIFTVSPSLWRISVKSALRDLAILQNLNFTRNYQQNINRSIIINHLLERISRVDTDGELMGQGGVNEMDA